MSSNTTENGGETPAKKPKLETAGEPEDNAKDAETSEPTSENNEEEKMTAFENTLKLSVPVSTVISISSLANFKDVKDLCKVLNGLVDMIESQGKTGDRYGIQTAVLDASEFMAANRERLCTRDTEVLKELRKTLKRFEALVSKLKSKFDYRSVSIFMEDSFGGTALTKNGALGSSFRKLKSKIFRAVTLTWEDREKLIETLLTTVNEKRRGFLREGRVEVRGYDDMSDEELQAWKIFASELVD